MADDLSLFGLHKMHLVKMSIANECACMLAHMHVRDPVYVGVSCVSLSESIQACVCICTFGCVNRM